MMVHSDKHFPGKKSLVLGLVQMAMVPDPDTNLERAIEGIEDAPVAVPTSSACLNCFAPLFLHR